MCDKRTGYAISAIVSVAASLAILCLSLLSPPGSLFYFMSPESIGIYGNVLIYLLVGGVFLLSFILMSVAVKRGIFPNLNTSSRTRNLMVIGLFVITVIVVCLLFSTTHMDWYITYSVSLFEAAVIITILTLISIIILYREKGETNRNWILYTIYAVVAIILGITVVTPDVFWEGSLVFGIHPFGSAQNAHHASAYIDSIYNVLHGVPFTGGITDQYGNYALFFYPFLKIFGENVMTISIIMGVLMVLTMLCLAGAVHITVKSNYLKALIVLAGGLCLASTTAGLIYWQSIPHRMFFPSVMILAVALYSRKDVLTKKEYAIGSLISTLAILWNFESGIATAAAWFMFLFIKYYQNNDFNIRNFAKNMVMMAGALAVYILVPFLIVNLYNYLVTGLDPGSLLTMSEFIGAMLDVKYITELNYRWKMISTTEFMMFTFLLCIAWALLNTRILSKGREPSTPSMVAASISIIGLVMLTKIINNAAGFPVEVWFLAAMAIGILASQMTWELKNIREWKKFDLYSLIKVQVCSLALIGLVMMGTHAVDLGENLNPQSSLNNSDFISFTEEIREHVPRDTLAYGDGTTAIYMQIGWDKQQYSFYLPGDELRELLSNNDRFLINIQDTLAGGLYHRDNLQFVPPTHHLVKEFIYNGVQFAYFERTA